MSLWPIWTLNPYCISIAYVSIRTVRPFPLSNGCIHANLWWANATFKRSYFAPCLVLINSKSSSIFSRTSVKSGGRCDEFVIVTFSHLYSPGEWLHSFFRLAVTSLWISKRNNLLIGYSSVFFSIKSKTFSILEISWISSRWATHGVGEIFDSIYSATVVRFPSIRAEPILSMIWNIFLSWKNITGGVVPSMWRLRSFSSAIISSMTGESNGGSMSLIWE